MRLVARLAIFGMLLMAASRASAQSLIDDFADGTISPTTWLQGTTNPLKAKLEESGGRLKFVTFGYPQEAASNLYLARLSTTWGLGVKNSFKISLRCNLQRPNKDFPCNGGAGISDQAGLLVHLTSVDTTLNPGTPPDGLAFTLSQYRYTEAGTTCVYRALSGLRITGGTSTTVFEYDALGTAFHQEAPSYNPATVFTLPEDELTLYVQFVPQTGRLRLAFNAGMTPAFELLAPTNTALRPMRLSIGGFNSGAIGALSGASSWIDDVNLIEGDVIPKPTGLAASQGTSTSAVSLSWDAMAGATKYHVFRVNVGASPELLGSPTGTTWTDDKAVAGVTQRYLIRAELPGGVSESSEYANGWRNVAVPTGVAASDGTSTANSTVIWTAVTGATGYKILRGADAGSMSQIGTSTTATFADTTGTPGVVYTYAVKASTSAGETASSGTDTGWRRTVAPTSLTASQGTSGAGVTLTWPASPGATAYNVYRAIGTGAQVELAEVATATPNVTYIDVSADPGQLYGYAITTLGAAPDCESAKSVTKTGWRPTAAPTAVTASDGISTASVTVGWAATPGAASYRVYRSTGGGASALVASPVATTFTDTTAVPGTLYSYVVKGFGGTGTGEGAASAAETGWRMLTAPVSVTATDGTSTANVGVSWPASTGAVSYKVLRSLGGDPPLEIKTVNAPAVTCTDTDAVPGTNYTYAVKAVGRPGTGESVASVGNVGWRMLSAPVGVSATDGTSTASVTVSWTAAPGAVNYQVFRSGTVAPIATTTETSFVDTGATIGVLFTYTVKAVGLVGTSAASTGNTGWRAPVAPAAVTAADGTSLANVALTWTAAPGAASYKVFRTIGAGAAAQVGTSVTTSFTDTTAVPGTLYTYTVKAAGAIGTGDGAASPADTGWRMLTAPAKATATDGTSISAVSVSWTASVGASGYRVLRAVGAGAASEVGTTGSGVLTYSDSSGTAGTIYTYTVKAIGAPGTGDSAASVSNTGYIALAAPTGVAASDGASASQVSISWSAVTGAAGYKIFRAAVQIGTTVGNGANTFNDTLGTAGTTFAYSVRAVGAAGVADSAASVANGGWRNLPAPAGLTASDSNAAKVIVSWSTVTGGTGYFIYRGTAPDALAKINGGAAVTTTTFNDLTAAASVTYYYAVSARSASGESALSAVDTGIRPLSFGPSGLSSIGGGGDGSGVQGPGGDGDPVEPAAIAPMGFERYLQVVAVTADAVVDCDASRVGETNGAATNAIPAEAPAAFVDLDANGVPDLCQLHDGDLDLDGTVSQGDLAILLTMVGAEPCLGIGDLDNDGVIDASDVATLTRRMAAAQTGN